MISPKPVQFSVPSLQPTQLLHCTPEAQQLVSWRLQLHPHLLQQVPLCSIK
jgi:hypothetical protein